MRLARTHDRRRRRASHPGRRSCLALPPAAAACAGRDGSRSHTVEPRSNRPTPAPWPTHRTAARRSPGTTCRPRGRRPCAPARGARPPSRSVMPRLISFTFTPSLEKATCHKAGPLYKAQRACPHAAARHRTGSSEAGLPEHNTFHRVHLRGCAGFVPERPGTGWRPLRMPLKTTSSTTHNMRPCARPPRLRRSCLWAGPRVQRERLAIVGCVRNGNSSWNEKACSVNRGGGDRAGPRPPAPARGEGSGARGAGMLRWWPRRRPLLTKASPTRPPLAPREG